MQEISRSNGTVRLTLPVHAGKITELDLRPIARDAPRSRSPEPHANGDHLSEEMRVIVEALTDERSRADGRGGVPELIDAFVLDLDAVPDDRPPRARGRDERSPDDARPTAEATLTVDVAGDESAVVLLESEGSYEWVFPDTSGIDGSNGRPRSRGAPGSKGMLVFTLDPQSPRRFDPSPPRARGLIGGVSRIAGRVVCVVLKFVVSASLGVLTRQLERGVTPALVHIDSTDTPEDWPRLPDTAALVLPTDRPARVLLLVHGTFSSTLGSFGALGTHVDGQALLGAALTRYDVVLGVDHYTLSATPEENASVILGELLALRRRCSGLNVDTLCFSRGGLVFRYLSERLAPERAATGDEKIDFGRALFVGCTNAGTELADQENWQTLVDRYTNLIACASRVVGLVPAARLPAMILRQGISTIGSLVTFMTQASTLELRVPGIEAMRPDGDLVRSINAPLEPPSGARAAAAAMAYFTLGARFEPGGGRDVVLGKRFLLRLGDGLVDRLMGEANDLVVDTDSMFVVDPLADEAIRTTHELPSDAGVHHTGYFSHPGVAAKLLDWLGIAAVTSDGDTARRVRGGRDRSRTTQAPAPADTNIERKSVIDCMPAEDLRDSTDLRDAIYRPSLQRLPRRFLPTFLDTRDGGMHVHVRDQGVSDRCTGYALASLIDMQRTTDEAARNGLQDTPPIEPVSAHMLFEMGALVSAQINGTGQRRYSIRSAIKGFYHNGACLESLWGEALEPGGEGFDMIACAKQARGLSLGAYFRLQHHLSDYHSAILEVGAVLVSAELHRGWSKGRVRAEGRIVPTDSLEDDGAHAFVIIGYDESGFHVLNSWGEDWGGRLGDVEYTPGVAHWSYKDWAESVMDAWVLRLGVPTPEAFEYTLGPQGMAYFGGTATGTIEMAGGGRAAGPISAPRQQVLGHYVHVEAGRYVRTGSYPDSEENLERTLDYLAEAFDEGDSHREGVRDANKGVERIYLRVTGDTGSVEDAMHRIARLRRYLRPRNVYPISIVWTARMASAFAVGIKACMREAVERMPDPTDDRNDLIESLIRPIGKPLWNQLKLEAATVASVDREHPGPLVRTLRHLNVTLDRHARRRDAATHETEHARRIDLVVEGAGALVFIELLKQSGAEVTLLLRHVDSIRLAFPVANHDSLLNELTRLAKLSSAEATARADFEALTSRIVLIRPNKEFLDKSSIGPYTRTWFDLVNNSFESEPLEPPTAKSLSLANDTEHRRAFETIGISEANQPREGPDLKRQVNGAAILRNSVVSREFIDAVLSTSGFARTSRPPSATTPDDSQAITGPKPMLGSTDSRDDVGTGGGGGREGHPSSEDTTTDLPGQRIARTTTSMREHRGRTDMMGSTNRRATPAPVRTGDDDASGHSLHIGVNLLDPARYDGWDGELLACEFDAEAMARIAVDGGYRETSTLLTSEATRESVIAAIRAIATKMTPGDIFFLSYAGHGGRLPDTSGDEDDGVDETWCLYDGQLIDDELYALWHEFPAGSRILLVSDSCHSGSVARTGTDGTLAHVESESSGGERHRARAMSRRRASRVYRKNRGFYDALLAEPRRSDSVPGASVRLLSGCQDNQQSLDGPFNGAFTTQLLRVWSNGAYAKAYEPFLADIRRNMPETQTPNHKLEGAPDAEYDAQRPFSI